MSKNGFYDMLNQYSVDDLKMYNENNYNYDLLSNIKYQSSHNNLLSGIIPINNHYSSYSLNNINYSKTESDFGKEINNKPNDGDNKDNNNNIFNLVIDLFEEYFVNNLDMKMAINKSYIWQKLLKNKMISNSEENQKQIINKLTKFLVSIYKYNIDINFLF